MFLEVPGKVGLAKSGGSNVGFAQFPDPAPRAFPLHN